MKQDLVLERLSVEQGFRNDKEFRESSPQIDIYQTGEY